MIGKLRMHTRSTSTRLYLLCVMGRTHKISEASYSTGFASECLRWIDMSRSKALLYLMAVALIRTAEL